MNVLHVNYEDLHGRRFNGYDLLSELASRGVVGKQAVLSKLSANPAVVSLCGEPGDAALQEATIQAERGHSMDHLLYPWGRVLAGTPEFRNADVVHYHLIHSHMLSLLDLPMLCAAKPSIWTFHDPWPMTGHCVHPGSCDGWLTGCSPCPSLDAFFPLQEDRADRMYRVKQRVFGEIDLDIVVASQFMRDMVRRSPLTRQFDRVHLIPFGIDTQAFLPDSEKTASRRALGIPDNHFVILVRATDSEFKGLPYVLKALGSNPPSRPTTLLTVDQRGLMKDLAHDYNIVDLGWVEDATLYPRVFSAADVLLMPSIAESFGLMALEGMAAGRPVICFKGTAPESVTHAPESGIAVRMCDSRALRAALDALSANPEEARRRGHFGRTLAATEYSHEGYLDTMASLYRTVQTRVR